MNKNEAEDIKYGNGHEKGISDEDVKKGALPPNMGPP